MATPSKNKKSTKERAVILGLSAVIVAVVDDNPRVFIVRGAEHALSLDAPSTYEDGDALPFGPFDPEEHATLEQGLRSWIKDQTPLSPGYVEQLYTFGNKDRYMGQEGRDTRIISVGYLALTRPAQRRATENLFWNDWYGYFPWEDWRNGPPSQSVRDVIESGLKRWVNDATTQEEKSRRRIRADICFGLNGAVWDEEKVLERYELLYEARLVYESIRDRGLKVDYVLAPGRSMLYDHRRILATAMGRLRGKLKYRPVVFELMPPEFTLLHLQKTVEAIAGHRLHKQNFRRLVESAGMVEEIPGKKSSAAGGRPAALFRFRKEVALERPAPGMKVSAAGG
jgi:hypothetical protein